MRTYSLMLMLAVISTAGALPADADTITLKNGDHLNGTLLDISDGLVSFRTKLAGRIMMPEDQVSALTTEGFLLVALNDKTALPGRIATTDGGFRVIGPEGATSTSIRLAEVEQVQRIPESKTDTSTQEEAAKLAINTGYRLRTGTRDSSGPTAGISLENNGPEFRTRMNVEGEYSEDADSADRYFSGELEVGKSDTDKLAPTLILEMERDRNKALKLGAQAAVGVTHRLLTTDSDQLEGFAGVGVRAEEHDPEPLRTDGVDNGSLANARDKNSTDLQLDVRLRYTRDVFSKATLTEDLKVQPSLGDPGEIRAEWESSLSVPLTLNVHLNFDLLLDYESETAYDTIDRWNTSLGAGLQIQF